MRASRRQFLKLIGGMTVAITVGQIGLKHNPGIIYGRDGQIVMEDTAINILGLPVSEELITDGGFLVPREYVADLIAAAEERKILRGDKRIIPL